MHLSKIIYKYPKVHLAHEGNFIVYSLGFESTAKPSLNQVAHCCSQRQFFRGEECASAQCGRTVFRASISRLCGPLPRWSRWLSSSAGIAESTDSCDSLPGWTSYQRRVSQTLRSGHDLCDAPCYKFHYPMSSLNSADQGLSAPPTRSPREGAADSKTGKACRVGAEEC